MKIQPRIRAFTLIELLVVMALMAILASMLLPVLARAKSRARMIEELSASRQLWLGFQMYADDHNGAVFPGYVTDFAAVDDRGQPLGFPENTRYPWRILPYLAQSMELIYAGENRAKLAELRAKSHQDYVYQISVYPSLGINSYFIGGNQSDFSAATVNARFGSGTIVTRMNEIQRPAVLAAFLSARSAVDGVKANGYYQVTPPFLRKREWAAAYAPSGAPEQWGFVAPRFQQRAVAALLDGHAQTFNLTEMQDMRHWCNRADQPDWTLRP